VWHIEQTQIGVFPFLALPFRHVVEREIFSNFILDSARRTYLRRCELSTDYQRGFNNI
jgi:hypothetical protein